VFDIFPRPKAQSEKASIDATIKGRKYGYVLSFHGPEKQLLNKTWVLVDGKKMKQ